jgi:hypothetical protein
MDRWTGGAETQSFVWAASLPGRMPWIGFSCGSRHRLISAVPLGPVSSARVHRKVHDALSFAYGSSGGGGPSYSSRRASVRLFS